MNRRNFLATGAALAAAPALAQPGFPSRPVEIVVPYAAGGPADRYVRAMTASLRESWGQPIVISNRPGAGASIGAATVARAAPDGHTVLMASFGLVSNPLLMRDLPYDPRALTPISLAAVGGMTLYTRASLGPRDVPGFLAAARAQPGGLRFGSSGVGSTPHVAAELFAARAGVEIIHVPYRGSGPALTDLLAGNLDAVFTATAGGPASSGALVPIATSGTRRSLLTPNVPTLTEAGLDVVARTWYGFLVPAGTPEPARRRLEQGFRTLAQVEDARRALTEDDLDPRFTDAAEFGRFIAEEQAYWAPVFRERNITT